MLAISAKEAASAKVQIQVARYTHTVPARPPLVSENAFASSSATHVDMVVVARPSTESDLKLRRSSCERLYKSAEYLKHRCR
jgi:hypothetical protein